MHQILAMAITILLTDRNLNTSFFVSHRIICSSYSALKDRVMLPVPFKPPPKWSTQISLSDQPIIHYLLW